MKREFFFEGIKYLPLIKDRVYLLEEERVSDIYGKPVDEDFIIGRLLKEEIPISLKWDKLFNTHIGVFGNTGSGKSNTLTKLYTTLFEHKIEQICGKSRFVVVDFNGEYATNQLVSKKYKTIYNLNTKDESDKFPLSKNEFWSLESLCILFQATANTQKPFINRIINSKDKYKSIDNSLEIYLKKTFERIFTAAQPKADSLDLVRNVASLLELDDINILLKSVGWNTTRSNFYCLFGGSTVYFNSESNGYNLVFKSKVDSLKLKTIDAFEELKLRCDLQLINDLIFGYVQYEFIQPLLKRIDASLNALKKKLFLWWMKKSIKKTVTIISFRKCNQSIKKVLPLLIAKHYYHPHRDNVDNPPKNTVHLIIDEAHNILSHQSTRESESWKDYRLEQFEEIIKEGRKFGFFLTLSSQRPADISPTIISQVHNFFIHRLVNERDLQLIDNSISTLDSISRNMIPNLSRGCCIVTGTSFDLPMVLQVDLLEREKQPDSEDVNLMKLWSNESNM